MALPAGGRIRVTWEEFRAPASAQAVAEDPPPMMVFPRTYRRPGTYLAIINAWDESGRFVSQEAIVLYLRSTTGSRSLSLWRRGFAGHPPTASQAALAGRNVTLSVT